MNTHDLYTVVEGPKDLFDAAKCLAKTERGRNAMRRVLDWLDDDGLGLDSVGQEAILTLLNGAWGAYGGTSRDAMREVL